MHEKFSHHFDGLQHQIPLEEAAAFFVRIKTAGWSDPPDMEGSLEGQFCCPVEQVVAKLSEVITAKYRKAVAYHIYAQTFRDPAWRSAKIEFSEHVADEADGAEYYVKRSTALGGPVHVQEIEPPPAITDPMQILKTMVRAEQEGIALQRELREMVGDENPMKAGIEEQMVKDQHHLDELWQMHPPGEPTPVLPGDGDPGLGVEPVEAEPAAEGAPAEEPVEEESPVEEKSAADKSDEELKEVGRQRAVASMAAEAQREKDRRGERFGGLTGRLVGGAGGALAGARAGSPLGKAGRLVWGAAGGLGGSAIGRQIGREIGTEVDIAKAAMAIKMARVKKAQEDTVAAIEDPMEEQGNEPVEPAQLPAKPETPETLPVNYLQAEQMAQEAQEANEANFYRGKLQENQAVIQGMQQQVAEAQEQLGGLQQQAAEAGAQIEQATQAAVAATDKALEQTQIAAKMRMGMQQMRAQMLEVASQEPDALAEQKQMEAAQAQAQQLQQGLQPPGGEQEGLDAGIEQGPPPEGPVGQAPAPTTPEAQPPGVGTEDPSAMKTGSLAARLGGAALGGALGAGGAAMEPGVEEAQQQVSDLQSQPSSFGQSLRLARAKAGLATAEHAEAHPVQHRIIGGLTGAALGAAAAPSALNTVKTRGASALGSLKRLTS